jgi:hypothetical protein
VGDGCANCFRLQSHSTLRTTARFRLVNVRMHGTGEHRHFTIMLLGSISLSVVLIAGKFALIVGYF